MLLRFYLFFFVLFLIFSPFYFWGKNKNIAKWLSMLLILHVVSLSLYGGIVSFAVIVTLLLILGIYEVAVCYKINALTYIIYNLLLYFLLFYFNSFLYWLVLPFIPIVLLTFIGKKQWICSSWYAYLFSSFFIIPATVFKLYMVYKNVDPYILLLTAMGLLDMFAYLGGKFLGGPRPFKNISPNKTISGYIIGPIGILLAMVVFIPVTSNNSLLDNMVLFFIIYIGGNLGDLLFSVLKRHLGVKDFGGALPGHGGIFDRCDSTFLVIPFYCMYFYEIVLK